MNICRKLSGAALSAVIFFGGGCLFEPYQESARFDLTVMKLQELPAGPVTVAEFRNNSSSGQRIQFRNKTTGQVTTDPYNSWVLPPGELLARALTLSLNSGSESGEGRLVKGALEVFEVVLPHTFRLAGKFRCDGSERFYRFDIEVPVEEDSASGVAAAASVAAGKLAETVGAVLRSGGK